MQLTLLTLRSGSTEIEQKVKFISSVCVHVLWEWLVKIVSAICLARVVLLLNFNLISSRAYRRLDKPLIDMMFKVYMCMLIELRDLILRCRDGWTSILLGSHLYPPTRSYQ